jgi:hypothetical protein
MHVRTSHTTALLGLWLLAVTVGGSSLSGQAGPAPAAGGSAQQVGLSGYWELVPDNLRIPPASLLPSVTPAVIAAQGKRDLHAVRWCHTVGLPMAMVLARPIEIRVGQREAYIVFEANAVVRHVYLARKTHINPDEFDPSTSGDSIGHWEGDTLVVDTIGFHGGRGVTAIPGGGFRTETSRLTERFRVMGGGTVLSVLATWTDPKMFRASHIYELRYARLPDSYEPRPPVPCDAYDSERIKYVEGLTGVALPAVNAAPSAAKPAAAPRGGGPSGGKP